MKKIIHLSLILLLFLTACQTQRIASLKPSVPSQFIDKEGFVTQKSDSLDVTFGFLFSTKDHLVFEVSVKNKSTDSVLVLPQNFFFRPTSLSDSTKMTPHPFHARSFTQLLDKLDERARERNMKAAAIVLVTIATVVAVDAAANKNTPPKNRDYSLSINSGTNLSFNYFDALIYNQLSKKEARKGLERSFMFPRTIGASESHIGVVYFPRYDNAKEMLINFKIGEHDFNTLFKQTIK